MDKDYFSRVEYVSFRVWNNLRDKFHSEYRQSILHACHANHLPVCVRWNNRNVYARVEYIPQCDFYEVFDLYKLTREGFPVKILITDLNDQHLF